MRADQYVSLKDLCFVTVNRNNLLFNFFSSKAEQQIARAVKLDPTKIEAWTELGECFWKKRDIEASERWACLTMLSKSRFQQSRPIPPL